MTWRLTCDRQRPSDVSSSLPLPEVPVPAAPVRLGRRRRLAVDSAIQLDREVLRRRIQEGVYDTMRATVSSPPVRPTRDYVYWTLSDFQG